MHPFLYWKSESITLFDGNTPFGSIALMNTNQHPALGGCRIVYKKYDTSAISLSLHLANAMHQKITQLDLPLNGGKTVLYIDDLEKKPYYLQKLAEKLNELQGKYITAVDIGTSQADMDYLSQYTPFLACNTALGGDPSPYTARTVLLGIKAAYQKRFPHALIEDLQVVIQGVGKVGSELVKQLRAESNQIKITICDKDQKKVNELKEKYATHAVDFTKIYSTPCHIFITAADSLIIDKTNIQLLNCNIFASAANVPFNDPACQTLLEKKNIWYLPDYLINGGGIIHATYQYGLINDLESHLQKVYTAAQDYLHDHYNTVVA